MSARRRRTASSSPSGCWRSGTSPLRPARPSGRAVRGWCGCPSLPTVVRCSRGSTAWRSWLPPGGRSWGRTGPGRPRCQPRSEPRTDGAPADRRIADHDPDRCAGPAGRRARAHRRAGGFRRRRRPGAAPGRAGAGRRHRHPGRGVDHHRQAVARVRPVRAPPGSDPGRPAGLRLVCGDDPARRPGRGRDGRPADPRRPGHHGPPQRLRAPGGLVRDRPRRAGCRRQRGAPGARGVHPCAVGRAGRADYQTIMHEGYGPGGIAVLVECLTDNRNRAASDVRVAFTHNGGAMADPGSVSYLFSRRGVVIVPKSDRLSEDDVLAAVLDAGAEEVNDLGEAFEVLSEPGDVVAVRTGLQEAGIEYDSAGAQFVPATQVEVDVDGARKILRLIDALDDLDDVQEVYANFDASDEVLAALEDED